MHAYTKMIVESDERLNKGQVVECSQQSSSTNMKVALRDTMEDKAIFDTEKFNEFVSWTKSTSFDEHSYMNLFIPHMLNSSNNAAQSTRTLSNENKRSSLLYNLLRRYSPKKKVLVTAQPLKKKIISGGDQVKLSSIRLHRLVQPDSLKQQDTIDNEKNIDQDIQLLSHGLSYDFKQMKTISDTKLSSKDSSIPFVSHLAVIQEKSLSSLSSPSTNEQKLHIQSSQNVSSPPKVRTASTIVNKISFKANQHKYDPQIPAYHFPKHLSTLELLAKKYPTTSALSNHTGLLWYNANEQTLNRTSLPYKHATILKKKNGFELSSDSQDTSSSSNSSSTSSSSSSSSTSSNTSTTCNSSQKTSKSNSSSSHQSTKATGPFNRNQNDGENLIQIDLNSSASRTSTSTNNTSVRPCYQRFISRKQSYSISSTTTTTSENNS